MSLDPALRLNSICNRLSVRETQVLRAIVSGARQKEAAYRLGISHRTVEAHRIRIRRKLGARTTADLVRIALRGT